MRAVFAKMICAVSVICVIVDDGALAAQQPPERWTAEGKSAAEIQSRVESFKVWFLNIIPGNDRTTREVAQIGTRSNSEHYFEGTLKYLSHHPELLHQLMQHRFDVAIGMIEYSIHRLEVDELKPLEREIEMHNNFERRPRNYPAPDRFFPDTSTEYCRERAISNLNEFRIYGERLQQQRALLINEISAKQTEIDKLIQKSQSFLQSGFVQTEPLPQQRNVMLKLSTNFADKSLQQLQYESLTLLDVIIAAIHRAQSSDIKILGDVSDGDGRIVRIRISIDQFHREVVLQFKENKPTREVDLVRVECDQEAILEHRRYIFDQQPATVRKPQPVIVYPRVVRPGQPQSALPPLRGVSRPPVTGDKPTRY
jgi:hypothetical protein